MVGSPSPYLLPKPIYNRIDRKVLQKIPGAKLYHRKRKNPLGGGRFYSEYEILSAVLFKLFMQCPWCKIKDYHNGIPARVAQREYAKWYQLGVFLRIAQLNVKYNRYFSPYSQDWQWLNHLHLFVDGQEPLAFRHKKY